MNKPLLLLYLALMLVATLGSNNSRAAGPRDNTMAAWDGHTLTSWSSPGFKFRISVPNTGYLLSVETAPAGASSRVPAETVVFLKDGGEQIRIESWPNPQRLGVSEWISTEMRFLDQAESSWFSMLVGKDRHSAIRLDQPRSPQALPHTVVFVAAGNILVRITCLNTDDAHARTLLDTILTSWILPNGGAP